MPETNHTTEKPFLSEEDHKILKEGLLKDYYPQDQEMFLRTAEKTRLDPFTKQIWMRPESKAMTSDGKYAKAVIICGIQGFLSVADRSGVYDGSSPIEWCAKDGQWIDVWLDEAHPVASKAEVWRKDRTRPEVAIVKWDAVVSTYFDSAVKARVPTDFWKRMPDYMIGKCALAAALRKAFPSQLTGVYETSEIPETSTTEPASDAGLERLKIIEADIEAQKVRHAEAAAAEERLKAQGVKTVEQPKFPTTPPAPRDPVAEVEPPDDLEMSPDGARPVDWYKHLSCDPINHAAYKGKTIEELDTNLIKNAAEKWVPKVRAKWDQTTDTYRELAEGLELAWEEAQMVQAQGTDTTAS